MVVLQRAGLVSPWNLAYQQSPPFYNSCVYSANSFINVRQFPDFHGHFYLKLHELCVHSAFLVRITVLPETSQQHILRNRAEPFDEELDFCIVLDLETVKLSDEV